MSRGNLGGLTSTTKEAPVSRDYDGRQDVRDAADLCDLLRMGRLPEAYIASPAEREVRELVRHRAKLVALRAGLKAQVHGVLAKQGLLPRVSDLFGVAGAGWL